MNWSGSISTDKISPPAEIEYTVHMRVAMFHKATTKGSVCNAYLILFTNWPLIVNGGVRYSVAIFSQ